MHAGGCLLASAAVASAQEDSAAMLRQELDALRGDYQKRIDQLEARIRELESREPEAAPAPKRTVTRQAPKTPAPAPAEAETAAETGRAARMAVDERFREDTETRDIARRPDAETMLADRIEDVLEGYIDITGYFRAGYGRSNEQGAQQAFGIPDFAKYRLGNETNNYGELAFSKTFYPAGVFAGDGLDEHDPVARMVYRMSFENPYDDYGTASNTDFGSPEVWGSLSNVIPGFSDAKIWAGNRFYRRHDININDFYFWDMSGGGGGIEDLAFGPGKFAFAWIGDGSQSSIYSSIGVNDPLNEAGFSKSNFDFRYYDWAFLGGTGEIGLVYAMADSGVDSVGNSAEDSDGFALGFVQTHKAFLDENSLHKLSLQIGSGPAKTFNSGFETFSNSTGTFIRPDPEESWRFRATDQIVVKPSDHFSIGGAAVYQYTDFGDDAPDQHWVSGGFRPIWHFNEVFSLAFEGGVDWVSAASSGPGGTLGKLTLAPQVSLGDEFFSRPVLRTFVTYGLWSEGLKGDVGGPDFAAETSGWSWGLQMESWW